MGITADIFAIFKKIIGNNNQTTITKQQKNKPLNLRTRICKKCILRPTMCKQYNIAEVTLLYKN